jgi:hypothetical protein
MYCPECGTDAGDANFCPECGADLKGVKSALGASGASGASSSSGGQPRTTGQRRKGGGGGGRSAPPAKAAASPQPSGRISPAIIWGAFGAVAIIVVVIVVMASGGLGGSKGGGGTAATSPGSSATPVAIDTSGSYEVLVKRANDLYDAGAKLMPNGIPTDQSSQYFAAASAVYKTAWGKQPGDPNMGTDWAISLFYGGDVDAALKQVNVVLQKNPTFQSGLYNKGIFLSHKSRFASGKQAAQYLDQAKTAFTAAVASDPNSDVAKKADSALQTLKSSK